ncbi:MAG: hypothetical protein ACD_5C00075G0009 [uncultured bacterium]|nr:MAG: hypothetical protein ACD_5C00075G0009 [uncultured bacterium]
MGQLQMEFIETRELKKDLKDLKEMYKDTLANMDNYEEICEEIKTLREKKKEIELKAQAQMGRAWDKIEELKDEIKAKKEIINDLAINDLMKGQTVEVRDEFENDYEPIWSVKWKKSDTIFKK